MALAQGKPYTIDYIYSLPDEYSFADTVPVRIYGDFSIDFSTFEL